VAAMPAIAAAERPDSVLALVEAHKATWARLFEVFLTLGN
jgi:hypothetical protein